MPKNLTRILLAAGVVLALTAGANSCSEQQPSGTVAQDDSTGYTIIDKTIHSKITGKDVECFIIVDNDSEKAAGIEGLSCNWAESVEVPGQ